MCVAGMVVVVVVDVDVDVEVAVFETAAAAGVVVLRVVVVVVVVVVVGDLIVDSEIKIAVVCSGMMIGRLTKCAVRRFGVGGGRSA